MAPRKKVYGDPEKKDPQAPPLAGTAYGDPNSAQNSTGEPVSGRYFDKDWSGVLSGKKFEFEFTGAMTEEEFEVEFGKQAEAENWSESDWRLKRNHYNRRQKERERQFENRWTQPRLNRDPYAEPESSLPEDNMEGQTRHGPQEVDLRTDYQKRTGSKHLSYQDELAAQNSTAPAPRRPTTNRPATNGPTTNRHATSRLGLARVD